MFFMLQFAPNYFDVFLTNFHDVRTAQLVLALIICYYTLFPDIQLLNSVYCVQETLKEIEIRIMTNTHRNMRSSRIETEHEKNTLILIPSSFKGLRLSFKVNTFSSNRQIEKLDLNFVIRRYYAHYVELLPYKFNTLVFYGPVLPLLVAVAASFARNRHWFRIAINTGGKCAV